jgi:stage V sporulation protein G
LAVEITEVRIKLMEEGSERLQAFCSITFDDCFVIRDLKIIDGGTGPFVAMPSRKLTAHCPQCGCKNHLRAGYCNQCGSRLKEDRTMKDEDGRTKLYADIAHPINSACREMIQNRVIREFQEELQRAKLPGYVSRYDDFDHDEPIAAPHREMRGPKREAPAEVVGTTIQAAPAASSAVGQTSEIQPPEIQPRPPHSAQTQSPNATRSDAIAKTTGAKPDSFGAGIF